ncbi:sigma-70 family RNA polymerase sigma factor [Clostridium autoethanogenum]|uniref:Sigma-70 family RNA polymerase sigma factor n=1 Tax=Clostridium autoethanogenum TaxID=84023 RepID=A0A3M0S181_9CLOT|nr:sigma-70 family RNA polymerase sigma factor [Clostridium autoethanogenum]RMC92322.1 sigma-70 family RNA polymerase sigma factor [Clostridium autoethanogenum]
MENDIHLKELIKGVKNGEPYWIARLETRFIKIIKELYDEKMFKHFGSIYEEDVINKCIYKMIVYCEKFRGSTWSEFTSYNKKIISSVIVNAINSNCKVKNITLNLENDFTKENAMDYMCIRRKESMTMEDAILNKIILEEMLEYLNGQLNEKERKTMYLIINYDNLKEYSRRNNCNYNALKQRVYRLRKKLNKLRKNYYLKIGLDEI